MLDQTDTPLPTLFCLPFAGGGASEYRLWPRMLDGVAEVRALQLPGRENLCTTPPLSSMDALMDILLPQVRACTGPFALFGHSLGALISYEIARRLQAAGDPAPKMLIASGRKAPSNRRHSALHKLSDADLKLKLLSFGGTPEKVMNHDGLMQMILPILRADLCVAETYAPPEMPALSCPCLLYTSPSPRDRG